MLGVAIGITIAAVSIFSFWLNMEILGGGVVAERSVEISLAITTLVVITNLTRFSEVFNKVWCRLLHWRYHHLVVVGAAQIDCRCTLCHHVWVHVDPGDAH